jgi:hypothetical protein
MGSKTVNPVTPLITGAAVTKVDTGGSTSTIVITATTAQSALEFRKLSVVFENYSTTASATITLTDGAEFSDYGQGNAAAVTLGTAATVVIGGKLFESARFKDGDGYANFTITTAATAYVTAFMLP